MRKAFFLIVLALQFFALSASSPAHEPIPDCFPCEAR